MVDARRRLVQDVNALRRASPRAQIENRRQRLDEMTRYATRYVNRRIETGRADLRGVVRQLDTLNPLATLERGYAIVQHEKTVVTDSAQVATGDTVNVRVRRGEFRARVEPDI
jgi:exodeoxyribonuclease VII large subunit